MKAVLDNYNQAPRKVRLVADLVRGKKVPDALAALTFLPKRAAEPIKKLISSAAANASAKGASASGGKDKKLDELIVKDIRVESAGMLKRYMPRAFGRATPIRRRRSRVKVVLASSLQPPPSSV